jgi:hypothetical protein
VANASLVIAVLAHDSPEPTFADATEAGPGMAVRYAEQGSPDKWIIVEDSPDPNQARDEFPETHPLAVALKGKRVGESFVLSKTSARDRIGEVKGILPKYVHRMRDIAANWQLRFPDQRFIQVFRTAGPGEKEGEQQPDFTDMKLIAADRYERIKEGERIFEERLWPFYVFAKALGCSTFDAFWHTASRPHLDVRSNHGRPEERRSGLEALKTCHSLVLDITAIASVALLDLADLITHWRGTLVISQATAAELRSVLTELTAR